MLFAFGAETFESVFAKMDAVAIVFEIDILNATAFNALKRIAAEMV